MPGPIQGGGVWTSSYHTAAAPTILVIVVGGIHGIICKTDNIVRLTWGPHAEHARARVTSRGHPHVKFPAKEVNRAAPYCF